VLQVLVGETVVTQRVANCSGSFELHRSDWLGSKIGCGHVAQLTTVCNKVSLVLGKDAWSNPFPCVAFLCGSFIWAEGTFEKETEIRKDICYVNWSWGKIPDAGVIIEALFYPVKRSVRKVQEDKGCFEHREKDAKHFYIPSHRWAPVHYLLSVISPAYDYISWNLKITPYEAFMEYASHETIKCTLSGLALSRKGKLSCELNNFEMSSKESRIEANTSQTKQKHLKSWTKGEIRKVKFGGCWGLWVKATVFCSKLWKT